MLPTGSKGLKCAFRISPLLTSPHLEMKLSWSRATHHVDPCPNLESAKNKGALELGRTEVMH